MSFASGLPSRPRSIATAWYAIPPIATLLRSNHGRPEFEQHLNEANYFQDGLWAQNTVNVGKNSTVEGPMIGGSETFVKPVTVKAFPVLTSAPVGAPVDPSVHATPDAPSYQGG